MIPLLGDFPNRLVAFWSKLRMNRKRLSNSPDYFSFTDFSKAEMDLIDDRKRDWGITTQKSKEVGRETLPSR